MENNENKNGRLDGFDTALNIENRQDAPIDEILNSEPQAAEEPTVEVVNEVLEEPQAEVTDEVAEEPEVEVVDEVTEEEPSPSVAAYTPSANYGYVPNGSYQNGGWQPRQEPVYINNKKPKKEHKPFRLNPIGFVAVILAVAIISAGTSFALCSAFLKNSGSTVNVADGNASTVGTITINGEADNAVEAVYSKVSPSVVGVRTTIGVRSYFFGESESSGEGTGIVYSSDGYIITCFHVIEDIYASTVSSSKVEVFLPNDSENGIEAKVVGYNKACDVALLKIDKTGLTAADFGTSSDLNVGQSVIAIGNPGGLQFMSSVSYGVISGLNRSISVEDIGEMKVIQTDAAINPGNSGGALCNTSGKVVAMNSSKYVSEEYEGMGFAIPIDTVLSLVKDILENKNTAKPYIGIEYYTNVTAEWLKENNLPTGIIIKSVSNNSPAYNAGLQSGDIIVEFNGTEITDSDTFVETLSKCTPGNTVKIKIYRGARYYEGTIKIGSNNSY